MFDGPQWVCNYCCYIEYHKKISILEYIIKPYISAFNAMSYDAWKGFDNKSEVQSKTLIFMEASLI